MKTTGSLVPSSFDFKNQLTAITTSNGLPTPPIPRFFPDGNKMAGNMERRVRDKDAIAVRNAWKKFGKGEKATQILSDLTMTVKEGTIYTLLGSSGCGKTTLLSCIVGITQLDNGDCRIFGTKPGSAGCGIPGRKVGYMPQEIAIYGEFTIREAMLYFGRINGMSSEQIEERMAFLIKFLHLPPSHRFVRSLSGGQQRRVSFAIALLHQPKILILDEPTVGVDPLLRKSIWNHLKELVETGKTTVVITTHYIEEASEAHRIGLMRNGRLLAEDSPSRLLHDFECDKLEDVFFKLCQRDTSPGGPGREEPHIIIGSDIASDDDTTDTSLGTVSGSGSEDSNNNNNIVVLSSKPKSTVISKELVSSTSDSAIPITFTTTNPVVAANFIHEGGKQEVSSKPISKNFNRLPPLSPAFMINTSSTSSSSKFSRENDVTFCPPQTESDTTKRKPSNTPSWQFEELSGYWNRMRALLLKNFLCMWRNIGFVLFIFCLPALQAVLFCLAIGGDPTSLPVGIVNHEVNDAGDPFCVNTPHLPCSLGNMSCDFVKLLPHDGTLSLSSFQSESEAEVEARKGNVWGYIVIPRNFSEGLLEKGMSLMEMSGGGGVGAGPSLVGGANIKMHLDMTSQQIDFAIQKAVFKTFERFSEKIMSDCGFNETVDVPKPKFLEPIYGTANSNFREFMAPGIILSIIFFMSVALTGSAFITERKEGMLKRTLVSGVTTGEIITAHMLTQYVTMAGQTLLVLVVMIWAFNVTIEGSTCLAVLLTLAQGTCGMAYGFLISCVCTEERNAIQMALGSFYPNLLLSGVVWPFESMPLLVRQMAAYLPQTMACEAMRSIFSRGWSFTHPKVWSGFAVSIGWSGVFWILALILAKSKKK